jgi:undecaprenyl-diphosphatase
MFETRKTLVGAAISLFSVLSFLIWLVVSGRADRYDFVWRQSLLQADPLGAEKFWLVVTFFGSPIMIVVLLLVTIIVLMRLRDYRSAWHIAFVMIGAFVVDSVLKSSIHRARPEEVFAHTLPNSYSFPSGHALLSFAFYIPAALILRNYLPRPARPPLLLSAIFVALLIGISRVFLGVHYPIDVFGGFIAASCCIVTLRLIEDFYFNEQSRK